MATLRNVVLATSAGALAACSFLAGPANASAKPGPWQQVIVTGLPDHLADVQHDVAAVGGQVQRTLPVIFGVSARVRAEKVAALRAMPGVRSVTADAKGHLMGIDPTLGYDVANDEGSLYNVGQITHAKDAWSSGWTGKGVDVALIDSGVSPVQGLTSGNVVNGPDLSFESQDPSLAHLDTFGHGTHMASIIVGRDAVESGGQYANAGTHLYNGIAPDARLISVKVASSDGGSDVSQVLAGIDWVIEHSHDPGFNIRVLNLSYGTDSTQSPSIDPLCYAVENAWRAGIVVVVASGNDGTSRTTLADPAVDPLVLAVGADDPVVTDSVGDDQVPSFAQRGTATRHVDVIAPGVHILGLRDPNSYIDQSYPAARVGSRFFRGSGTSQATAVVSGLAALYLQRYPTATPDQVKRVLMTSASPPSSVKPLFSGLGVPDVNKALGVKPPAYVQAATGASGTGSLEAARGSVHAYDGYGSLTGELDIFGNPWNGANWAAASASGTAWANGSWNGTAWTGSGWSDTTWSGASWGTAVWSGSDWTSHLWSSHLWSAHSWTSSGWDAHLWTDSSWTSHCWTSAAWSSASWS